MSEYQEPASPAQQYRRLLDTYGIPQDRRAGWLVEMADAFGAYPLAVLTQATTAYIKKVSVPADQYHEVPTPGTFAEWVYGAMEAAEREEQKALPPPARDTAGWDGKSGPERVRFLRRHLAIGVFKGRGNPEPTAGELAEMERHLERRGFCRTTLERIAAGEAAPLAGISEGMTARWPGAPE